VRTAVSASCRWLACRSPWQSSDGPISLRPPPSYHFQRSSRRQCRLRLRKPGRCAQLVALASGWDNCCALPRYFRLCRYHPSCKLAEIPFLLPNRLSTLAAEASHPVLIIFSLLPANSRAAQSALPSIDYLEGSFPAK